MRTFLIVGRVVLVFLTLNLALAQKSPEDTLLKSYKREIIFLKSYQRELKTRTQSLNKDMQKKLFQAENHVNRLESKWLGLQVMNEKLMDKLNLLEREKEAKADSKNGLESIVQYAFGTSAQVSVEKNKELVQQLEKAFEKGLSDLSKASSIRSEKGEFFDLQNQSIQGEIIHFGSVAKFGVSTNMSGPLFPVGGQKMKIWAKGRAFDTKSEGVIKTLPIFLSDDFGRAFEKKKEKSWWGVVQSGGYIGYFICFLGGLASILSVVRFFLLQGKEKLSPQHILQLVKSSKNKTREQIEDVIAEGIIRESQVVDRFGSVILVMASVAPLLGLLGTVTGMISTFDRITEFGTGNPRLLSGGISEALVTTMLGLVVAIPTLLLGQYLNAKSERIKDEMERVAFEALGYE